MLHLKRWKYFFKCRLLLERKIFILLNNLSLVLKVLKKVIKRIYLTNIDEVMQMERVFVIKTKNMHKLIVLIICRIVFNRHKKV